MEKRFLVPVLTPFNDDETVNYTELKKLVRKVLDDGADGIYASGSSAECFLLTDEERKKTLETVIDAADGAYVCAHVGDISNYNTVQFARHAEKAGANSVSSVPPVYFGYSFQGIKSYYSDLASATKLPTLIYNFPGNTGVKFSIENLVELLNIDNVESLKFTDTDYFVMERVKKLSGKFVYSGKDECFLSALAAGADGAIGTTFNFMMDKYIRIKKAFDNNDVKLAQKIQESANIITKAVLDTGSLFSACKYLIELQGIKAGAGRKPFVPLTDEQKVTLKKVYEENIDI